MVDVTAAGVIGIQWDEGAANGATPVIDYRITYAEATSMTWLDLAD